MPRSSRPLAAVFACLIFQSLTALAAAPGSPTATLRACVVGDAPADLQAYALTMATTDHQAHKLVREGTCFSGVLPRGMYLVRASNKVSTGQAPLAKLDADTHVELKLYNKDGTNPALAAKLHEMARIDQAARKNLDFTNKAALRAMAEVDQKNERDLRDILKTYGWPNAELVGLEADHDCWLLTQHAPDDLRKTYLPAMEAAAARGELEPANVALTIDRVLVHEGKKQLYGSQFTVPPTGELKLDPVEDPEHLDERRAAMGLEPFAAYRARFPTPAKKAP